MAELPDKDLEALETRLDAYQVAMTKAWNEIERQDRIIVGQRIIMAVLLVISIILGVLAL
jgi:hypothetical protein